MDINVFYAWQSDSPRKTNLNFIQDAIEKAIKILKKDLALEVSPRLDKDTKGVSGSPAIADTILEKIRNSAMIVADVTLVGSVDTTINVADTLIASIKLRSRNLQLQQIATSKRTPNPNVLIEAGNAAEAIGWDRVILVMNTHFGESERLPFDLIHRRFPLTYTLGLDASEDERRATKKELVEDIVRAIGDAHEADFTAARKAITRLDIYSLLVISIFKNSPFFRDLGQDEALQEELRNVISVAQFHDATIRLLDIGLIWTDVDGNKYAYHWTYLGTVVLRTLDG